MAFNAKYLKAENIRSRIDNDEDLPVLITQTYIGGADDATAVAGVAFFIEPITNGQIAVGDTIKMVTGTGAAVVLSTGAITVAGTYVAIV